MLKKDRELLWIPVLSFVSSIVVLGAAAVPTLALIDTSGSGEESTANPRSPSSAWWRCSP
ncbi:MAG: hypothetical protein R2695_10915 [Acidimicrobiales bacterium]